MIQPYSFTYSSLNVAQQSTFARRDQGGQEEERTRNREQAPTRDNNQAALFKKVEALEKSLSLQSTREQNTSNNPLLEPDTPSSREYRDRPSVARQFRHPRTFRPPPSAMGSAQRPVRDCHRRHAKR